jgi:DNA repair protein RadC
MRNTEAWHELHHSACEPALVCEARGESIRTPEDALRVCADLSGLAQEAFHVLTLNTRNKLVNRHMSRWARSTPPAFP